MEIAIQSEQKKKKEDLRIGRASLHKIQVKKEEAMVLAPEESEVVEILENFEAIHMKSGSRFGFPFTWGRKKRRSAIRFTISPSMLYHRPETSSAAADDGSQSPPPCKAEASSPATPLSFSPSESEDKPPLFRRNVSLKRKREHYLKIIEELNKDNNGIQGEIKNVKCYFDRLKNFNLKLKARKQELSQGAEFANVLEEQLQFRGEARSSLLIATNQTVSLPEFSANGSVTLFRIHHPTTSLGVASTTNNNDMGPIGIPDLNLPVDTCEEEALDVNFDDKKSNRDLAALARQKRIQICRIKNPIANNRMRYSCR